uniref:5'-3' deoxyribonucleotidase n=1 Tax=Ochrobactrum phage ORM_20 TaxID=2985243 RepID=A0A9N6WWM2_9VIRU|nr:5'-3' deoxyribonucleotidase [Ochrobactrum phage ORM_20]
MSARKRKQCFSFTWMPSVWVKETPDMAHNIFIDLDGVMADFDGYFFKRFGRVCQIMEDDEMWSLIDSEEPNFFLNLPLMENSIEIFAKTLEYAELAPIFLTACPKHTYHAAAEQKKEWVKRNICERSLVLPVLGGANKRCFLQNRGDVLIDDFEKNIIPWIQNGGHGIHHKSVEDTKQQLDQYFNGR